MSRRCLAAIAMAGAGLMAGCSQNTTSTPSASASTSAAASASTSAAASGASTSTTRNGSVVIIGDSLTYQFGNGQKAMTQVLEQHGWAKNKICWSGVDGRTIVDTIPGGAPSTQQEIARCRKQVGEPDVWIIALITNDLGNPTAQIAKDMNTVLKTIGPSGKVLWVNAGRQDLGTQTVLDDNPVVAKVIAGRSGAKVADWFGYLKAHPKQTGWWIADGTHMTPVGYRQRNTFIADQARQLAG